MVGDGGRIRAPDVTLECVPNSVSGLKGGNVSVNFHVKFELADEAFKVHRLQGKSVIIDIYEIEED